MADLVREHVGLREVARRVELPGQDTEESELEVDAVVEQAVEGPRLDGGRPARRLRGPFEGDDRRGDVRRVPLP